MASQFLLEEPEPAAPQLARAHIASPPFLLEESEPAALQHQSRPGQPGNKAGAPITSGAARSVTEAQGRGRPHAHTLTTEGRALPPPRAAPAGSLGVALAPCSFLGAVLAPCADLTWLAQWKADPRDDQWKLEEWCRKANAARDAYWGVGSESE